MSYNIQKLIQNVLKNNLRVKIIKFLEENT